MAWRTTALFVLGACLVALAVFWFYNPSPVSEPFAPKPSAAAPSFDVVRVDKDGMAVIAGRSDAFAYVSLFNGETIIGSARASGRSEWVIVLDKPLALDRETYLRLKAKNRDGSELFSKQIITIGALKTTGTKPLIILTDPGKASKVMQSRGVASAGGEILLETVDYDQKGWAIFSGKAIAGYKIRLYLNQRFIGQAIAKENERWQIIVENLPEGHTDLRMDLSNLSDQVVARITLPFKRNFYSLAPNQITIQPGDNLWTIARNIYGAPVLYTLIYENNRRQIKDPDLIYPGQIFTIPKP